VRGCIHLAWRSILYLLHCRICLSLRVPSHRISPVKSRQGKSSPVKSYDVAVRFIVVLLRVVHRLLRRLAQSGFEPKFSFYRVMTGLAPQETTIRTTIIEFINTSSLHILITCSIPWCYLHLANCHMYVCYFVTLLTLQRGTSRHLYNYL
jgi:hypothetical protein